MFHCCEVIIYRKTHDLSQTQNSSAYVNTAIKIARSKSNAKTVMKSAISNLSSRHLFITD